MSGIGNKAERAEIRARVQFVVDAINECYGLDIPQAEVKAAMHSTEALCDFARRYGQSIDWIALGNARTMVMDRAHDAGWRRRPPQPSRPKGPALRLVQNNDLPMGREVLS